MKTYMITVAVLLICIIASSNSRADRYEKWHWTQNLPKELEYVQHYPKHRASFDRHKHYKFQTTAKTTDFLAEIGRPDRFSTQFFWTEKLALHTQHQSAYPGGGTFQYQFKDGTRIYVVQGNGLIELAFIFRKGDNKGDLLYK